MGFLTGVRVLEVGGELVEYCGKLLAGLGADVIKVEPPQGESTRAYGPFVDDRPDPEQSLYFWHYNFGKRGITLDLDVLSDQERFRQLAARSDVILEGRPRGYMTARAIDYQSLAAIRPEIILARVSPFGDSGPWADYAGSDLIHLAMGGVMMNCGYDPEPSGHYDLPPIAPQMWHAYHVTGEMVALAVMAAQYHSLATGQGQYLSAAVHDAVSKQTEIDLPSWVYSRRPVYRRTCRHARPEMDLPLLARSKDGRWMLPYRTHLLGGGDIERDRTQLVELLQTYGMANDVAELRSADSGDLYRRRAARIVRDFVGAFLSSRDIWREAQRFGLTWAPVRKPEENIPDAHWASRETFFQLPHPQLGRPITHVGARWMAPGVPWRRGPVAPKIGQHNDEVATEVPQVRVAPVLASSGTPRLSKRGKPFALDGVRIIDLGWLLASGGAGRFLAALGAEVIRVEHRSRPDVLRWGVASVPAGGRAVRDAASAPLIGPAEPGPNRSGYFMEINAGKRAISLDLKQPRGKELLSKLVRSSHALIEGFTPGTMNRLGLGPEALQKINPRLVYVQQSGMGEIGLYGGLRAFGPIAQAFSGLTEMSGLPEPYAPAGIGYSYLDWFGAYNVATAVMAGLYRQRTSGQGCRIDASMVEVGTYLLGSSILDFSVNGRSWQRYGNRSPYPPAAPHGAYPTAGEDRWIAIACFTDPQWHALLKVLQSSALASDPRFGSLPSRLAHQDELDQIVSKLTGSCDGYELMHQLQRAGVPAGVCQTAEDRCDHDPQLKHLEWMVELQQSEIGMWPVREFPVKLSETPAYMGGIVDRHGPNYGEDNDYVYGQILGLSSAEIADLASQGVI